MIYIHFDLEVTLRSSDLRSTGDLDLMRSPYTYSDAFSMVYVGTAILLQPSKFKSYWQKTPLSSNVAIFTF